MKRWIGHPAVLATIALAAAIALGFIMLWDPPFELPSPPVTNQTPDLGPPRMIPIVTVPVATRLATAYDEYGAHARPELRAAFIALGRENPAAAIAFLSARVRTEARPHLMRDLPELAIRTGGQAALAVIAAYSDRDDLDFASRTAMIEAIARARLSDAVMLLVDWQERSGFAMQAELLRDTAVSLGTAADATALGERAMREVDAPRQARLLAFKRAITDKLRQHEMSAKLQVLDTAALIQELEAPESQWSRVNVVQRLERIATADAIVALGKAVAESPREDVRINAWAALLRLALHDTHARRVAYETLATVDRIRRESMCPVFVH